MLSVTVYYSLQVSTVNYSHNYEGFSSICELPVPNITVHYCFTLDVKFILYTFALLLLHF